MVAKIKSDIIFLSIELLIDTSWHFIHALSLTANKFQPISSMHQELSKTPYNDHKKLVSIIIIFSLKKLFPNPLIFINRKNPTIEQ